MSNLDLRAHYSQYRIVDEPGWGKVKGAPPVIACRNGHISAWGRDTLAASTNQRGPVATKLAKIGQLWNDADDGVTILFSPDQFADVAKVMVPRRRKRLSPEHQAKLSAAAARNHFQPGCGARQSKRQRALAA
jgi:hypothetical protein